MPLTSEEKAERFRQRMVETAKQYSTGTYVRRFVSNVFQRMVRAESGADSRPYHTAVVDGEIRQVKREIGQCVCITCGKVLRWDSGIKGMHTGHFLASRRNSILFEEDNVAPQCSSCNFFLSGSPQAFRIWMERTRGLEVIERLEQLKRTSRQFALEELVDMRMAFTARLKAAEERMKGC
jgi:hypothetical protein